MLKKALTAILFAVLALGTVAMVSTTTAEDALEIAGKAKPAEASMTMATKTIIILNGRA